MPNLNQVFLEGHLGQDPEVGETRNGKSEVKFSLATSEKGRDGQEDKTTWHNVKVYGYATTQAQTFKKGDAVRVEGKIDNYQYEKDGVTKYGSAVIGFKAHKIAWVKRDVQDGFSRAPQPTSQPEAQEDELPF